jgi:hypothetical protein
VKPPNPPVVNPPAPVEPPTAAERYGWGTPLPQSDEFGYTGSPDPAKWDTIDGCWSGHDGNGKRCGANSTVDGEKLIQKGDENGDTGWLASKLDQRYGRWEARVRSFNTGGSGNEFHPLLIVWPKSDSWPQDGEYDFLENQAPGEECANGFIHYPHPSMPVQQEFLKEDDCGAPLSEWHTIAFEWSPEHVRGYVDGKEWYTLSDGAGPGGRKNIQDMPSGHLTIQFDNFYGGGMRPANYEVDWVRIYPLDPIDPKPAAAAPTAAAPTAAAPTAAAPTAAAPTASAPTGPTSAPAAGPAAVAAPSGPAAAPASTAPAAGPASTGPTSGRAAGPATAPAPTAPAVAAAPTGSTATPPTGGTPPAGGTGQAGAATAPTAPGGGVPAHSVAPAPAPAPGPGTPTSDGPRKDPSKT